jgi:glycerophosphoryl diester phosphodiesterase
MPRELASDFLTLPLPRAFAHRGAGGDYPENTLVSFQAAADAGAEYFELDVHMTRDGEIVVSHDDNLERNCGARGVIRELTWAEVARADAGARFSPDGGKSFPFRGRGIAVPRLADVFAAFPRARMLIEIKQTAPSLVAHLHEVIDRAAMRRRVLLASEHDEPIREIHALAPEIPTNLPYYAVAEFLQALAARSDTYRPRGDALQIPIEYEGWKLVSPESIAYAHRVGLEVHVWTVNEESEMRALLEMGVDGIISDYPARLLGVIRSLAQR